MKDQKEQCKSESCWGSRRRLCQIDSWPLNLVGLLWRPRIACVNCISFQGEITVSRSAEILSAATQAQVILEIRWPLWWSRKRRLVCIWADRDRGDSISGPSSLPCKVEQTDGIRLSRVVIQVPSAAWGDPGDLKLEIIEKSRGTPLGRLVISILGPGATQELLLANLRVHDVRLWIRDGAEFYPGSLILPNATTVIPEFRIAGCPISAFVPPPGEMLLTLNLISGDGQRRILEQRKVGVGLQPVTYRGLALRIGKQSAISGPGSYQLQMELGDHEIGRARFRVLTEPELLQQVTVAGIQIDAERRDGQIEPGLKTLRWEEHQAFRPELQIETEVPAPNSVVRCIVRTLQGTKVLRREEFLLPLNRTRRRVKLRRMEFGIPGLQARPKPARLLLSVCIGGEVKASVPVLVLPPERITNFEGQLRFDAHELPVDQAEYEQIVQRLGLASELSGNEGFWARIIKLATRS